MLVFRSSIEDTAKLAKLAAEGAGNPNPSVEVHVVGESAGKAVSTVRPFAGNHFPHIAIKHEGARKVVRLDR